MSSFHQTKLANIVSTSASIHKRQSTHNKGIPSSGVLTIQLNRYLEGRLGVQVVDGGHPCLPPTKTIKRLGLSTHNYERKGKVTFKKKSLFYGEVAKENKRNDAICVRVDVAKLHADTKYLATRIDNDHLSMLQSRSTYFIKYVISKDSDAYKTVIRNLELQFIVLKVLSLAKINIYICKTCIRIKKDKK